VRPEVVAHPAENKDPKVALHPVPAELPSQNARRVAHVSKHKPFEHWEIFVRISRTKNGIQNTGQENKESNQEIAEFTPLQILVEPSANEDRKS
jgi:hypothetical protein